MTKPEADGSQFGHGDLVEGETVEASVDVPELLELAEETLDEISLSVEVLKGDVINRGYLGQDTRRGCCQANPLWSLPSPVLRAFGGPEWPGFPIRGTASRVR